MISWKNVYYKNRLDQFGIRIEQFLAKPEQVLWRYLDQRALRLDPLACYRNLVEAEADTRPDFLPLLPQQALVKNKLALMDAEPMGTPRPHHLRSLMHPKWPF